MSPERAQLRAEAGADLADLQPALAAARAAWEPYRVAIGAIEDDLRSELRPAMWKANHDAVHASFGHHHTAARRATTASQRVDDAEARIAAVYTHGAGIKRRLDGLETEARNLAGLAHPPGCFGLEDFKREELHQIDQVLNAVDVRARWTDRKSVVTTELGEAVAILTEFAGQAPLFAVNPGAVDRSQWTGVLEPVIDLLRGRGLEAPAVRAALLERTVPELGIEL